MQQTKALYNLLRLNARTDPTIQVEKWALEDLRSLNVEGIWKRLKKFGIQFDRNTLIQFSEECDSPEQLAELLSDESFTDKERDQIYLLIFELWRRFLPEKKSLSIFCDELDDQIDLYDRQELKSDEPIQDGLESLAEILEEHVDAGMTPQEAFQSISEYLANDLESFLCDYILTLLDQDNVLYAGELLEQYAPYLPNPQWVQFLQARVLVVTDIEETNLRLKTLLTQEIEPDLLFEMLRLLVSVGEKELFLLVLRKLLPKITDEEALDEMISLTADYYRRLDQDALEQSILKIQKDRNFQSKILKFKNLVFS